MCSQRVWVRSCCLAPGTAGTKRCRRFSFTFSFSFSFNFSLTDGTFCISARGVFTASVVHRHVKQNSSWCFRVRWRCCSGKVVGNEASSYFSLQINVFWGECFPAGARELLQASYCRCLCCRAPELSAACFKEKA